MCTDLAFPSVRSEQERAPSHLPQPLRALWYSLPGCDGDQKGRGPVRNLSVWQAVAIATELGLALAIGVVLGLLLGRFLDERLGLQVPVFMLLGALLGLASGVFSFARMVQFVTRPRKE